MSLLDRLQLTLDEKEIFCSVKDCPEGLREEKKKIALQLSQLFTAGTESIPGDLIKANKYKDIANGIDEIEQSLFDKFRALFTTTTGLHSVLGFINSLRAFLSSANKLSSTVGRGFLPAEFGYVGLIYGVSLIFDIGVVLYCTFYNYILCSKSSLPTGVPAEPNKLYVAYKDDGLHYAVLNKQGITVDHIISNEDFNNIVGDKKNGIVSDLQSDDLRSLQPFLSKLLDVTAKQGNTFYNPSGSWQRFKHVAVEDGRHFRMANDALWFSLNLTALIITGGLFFIVSLVAVVVDVIATTVKNIIDCRKYDGLVEKVSDLITKEEKEKKSLENSLTDLRSKKSVLEKMDVTVENKKQWSQELAQINGQTDEKKTALQTKEVDIKDLYDARIKLAEKADEIFYSGLRKIVGGALVAIGTGFALFPPTAVAVTVGIVIALVGGCLVTGLVYNFGSFVAGTIAKKVSADSNPPQNMPSPKNSNTLIKGMLKNNASSQKIDSPNVKIGDWFEGEEERPPKELPFFSRHFSSSSSVHDGKSKEEQASLLNNQPPLPPSR